MSERIAVGVDAGATSTDVAVSRDRKFERLEHAGPGNPTTLGVGAVAAMIAEAILRATGYKSLHDEASAYLREVAAAKAATTTSRRGVNDWYAFTLSFKGVLLEGLEVVFIVITFGANQHNVGAAVIGAAAAVLLRRAL